MGFFELSAGFEENGKLGGFGLFGAKDAGFERIDGEWMNGNQQRGCEAVGGEAGPASFSPFAIATQAAMHRLRLGEESPAAKNLSGPLACLGQPIGTK